MRQPGERRNRTFTRGPRQRHSATFIGAEDMHFVEPGQRRVKAPRHERPGRFGKIRPPQSWILVQAQASFDAEGEGVEVDKAGGVGFSKAARQPRS